MRLINANRLIMHLNDWQLAEGCAEGWNYKKDKTVPDYERQIAIYRTIDQCILAVMEQSIVEAEPVRHGHWIDAGSNDDMWRCSVCKNLSCCYGRYCPSCGAKMDGGDL